MVWCTIVDFELILARFCDSFWVTIRSLLDFSIAVSIYFFPTVSCSLNPGDHDRSRFCVQFGVVLNSQAEIKMEKFPCTDHTIMNVFSLNEFCWRSTKHMGVNIDQVLLYQVHSIANSFS